MLGSVLTGQLGFAAELTTGLPGMTAIAVVAAALALLLTVTARAVVVPAESPVGAPTAVRRRTDRTAFLSLCDPGADGRPRPRAPSI